MPTRAPRQCRHPGCPGLTQSTYCEIHKRKAKRSSDQARPSARQRGYDRRWEEYRANYLAQNPDCQQCGDPATVVDHIVPVEQGGSFWDPRNHQPMCKRCHDAKSATENGGFGNRRADAFSPAIPTTVICGPPGAGKTTWVGMRKNPGDLVVDMDALYHALSGLPWYEKPEILLPFVCEARDAVLRRLARKSDIRHAWVIASGARKADRDRYRAGGAEVIVLETPIDQCLRRIMADSRRSAKAALWENLVRRWWRDYEPPEESDVVVKAS